MAVQMLDAADIVIFGGTGDLSLRKILPALFYRFKEEQLNPAGRVIVLGRSEMPRNEFIALVHDNCKGYIPAKDFDDKTWQDFSKKLHFVRVDSGDSDSYGALAQVLSN
ncbi:MAG: glucose-6-phosphate dehydrogenase, partial [Alphaproteobacteria bacterium]|nr:glucose-6-phosphate dehydrogenase [Alphaproteobacteria bacterium]